MNQEINALTENFLDVAKVRNLLSMCPTVLNGRDKTHVLVFRRILEIAVTQGRWYGAMPEVS